MRRRWPLLLLATLPLWLLGLGILWASPRLFYHSTGDPLYDHFARMTLAAYSRSQTPFWERLAQKYNIPTSYGSAAFSLNSFELEQFRNDPHFPELSFWLDGVSDKRTMAEEFVHAGRATPGMFVAYSPRLWYADNEDKALAMCDTAIRLDPDNSFFYYQKAGILLSLGEIEEATEVCQQGNRAPRNEVVWPYSISRIVEHGPGWGAANELAAGVILAKTDGHPSWIQWKEIYKNLEVATLIGAQPQDLDPFVTMARRIGQMKHQNATGMLLATVGVEVLLGSSRDSESIKAKDEFRFDLTPQQQREALYIRDQLGTVRQTLPPLTEDLSMSGAFNWATSTDSSWEAGGGGVSSARALRERSKAVRSQADLTSGLAKNFDCLTPAPLTAWDEGRLAGTPVPSDWQPEPVRPPAPPAQVPPRPPG